MTSNNEESYIKIARIVIIAMIVAGTAPMLNALLGVAFNEVIPSLASTGGSVNPLDMVTGMTGAVLDAYNGYIASVAMFIANMI